MTFCSCVWSTPGSGTCARKRKTTSMPSVKRILLRRSGVRNASSSALNMPIALGDQHDGAAGLLDLLARRSGDRVRVDLELPGDLTVRQDLDLRVLTDEALRREHRRRDLAALGGGRETVDVHRDERAAEPVLEPAHLRDAHVDGRLS